MRLCRDLVQYNQQLTLIYVTVAIMTAGHHYSSVINRSSPRDLDLLDITVVLLLNWLLYYLLAIWAAKPSKHKTFVGSFLGQTSSMFCPTLYKCHTNVLCLLGMQ